MTTHQASCLESVSELPSVHADMHNSYDVMHQRATDEFVRMAMRLFSFPFLFSFFFLYWVLKHVDVDGRCLPPLPPSPTHDGGRRATLSLSSQGCTLLFLRMLTRAIYMASKVDEFLAKKRVVREQQEKERVR